MRTSNFQLPTPKGLAIVAGIALVAFFAVRVGAAAPSPIADAAARGDAAGVRALIAKKADVNAPQNDGATALHWAAFRGNLELAEILLRAGANPKAANREGATALWIASVNGDHVAREADREMNHRLEVLRTNIYDIAKAASRAS